MIRSTLLRPFFIVLLLFVGLSVKALTANTYYLYNEGADMWLDFGGSENYTACFKPHGAPIKLTKNTNGTWTLGTPFSKTDNQYLSADGLASTSDNKAAFTITQLTDGSYTIAVDGKYLGFGGASSKSEKQLSMTLVKTDLTGPAEDTEVSADLKWQLYTKTQLVSRLTEANEENPVDATFYIQEPNFNHNGANLSAWHGKTTGNCDAYKNNYGAYACHAATSIYQSLTGLKPGYYKVRCQGLYCHGEYSKVKNYTAANMPNYAYIFAGSRQSQLKGILEDTYPTKDIFNIGVNVGNGYVPACHPWYGLDIVEGFDRGMYQGNEVMGKVGSDGKMDIGIILTELVDSASWMACDNFELYYLGNSVNISKQREEALQTIERDYGNTIASVKATYTEQIAAFEEALSTARTTITNAEDEDTIESALSALAKAYTTLTLTTEPAEGYSFDYSSYITNPSFETGNMNGWVYTAISGDHNAKSNADEIYTVNGCVGNYLFNTWQASDGFIADNQDFCVYQTMRGLPEGEYRITVLESGNNGVAKLTLFANDFTTDYVPTSKSTFKEVAVDGVMMTPDVRSLTMGLRSTAWFRCDNFRLLYKGRTAAYEAYTAQTSANASMANPMMIDAFDGQKTDGWVYTKESGLGKFPYSSTAKSDYSMEDRSKLQIGYSTLKLGNATACVTYTDLPKGYYKVTSHVRVYDLIGTYNGQVSGLSIYANAASTPIIEGTRLGTNKAFSGEYSTVVLVEEGNLEAGFRIQDATFNQVTWQNFRVEYVGQENPMDRLVNLNLKAGEYTPLCMPYTLLPEYFGPLYLVAQVVDGVATLIPTKRVSAGQPCVTLASGENPAITLDDVSLNYNEPARYLCYWNNAYMRGSYEDYCWTAYQNDGTEKDARSLSFVVADLQAMNFTATQENRACYRYWNEVESYTVSSSTRMYDYLNEPTQFRRDQPNAIVVPVLPSASTNQTIEFSLYPSMADAVSKKIDANSSTVNLFNLEPLATYYYKVSADDSITTQGQFTVEGKLRMLYVGDRVYNARDLGGKKTSSGKYVRYGKIVRSGELNGGYVATTAELKVLRDYGIGAEIDLRHDGDNGGAGSGTSAYGFVTGKTFYYANCNDYLLENLSEEAAQKRWQEEFNFIVDNLENGRSVNFHCRIGADRTGLLALLLEGLMGVSETDLFKDYETTSFSTAAGVRVKATNGFNNMVNFFTSKVTSTKPLQKVFNEYFTKTLGVKQATINSFLDIMLTDQLYDNVDVIPAETHIQHYPAGIYDLSGRKVASGDSALSRLPSGIYVKDGKKFVVK